VLGHIWSIFADFKGGKGIATGLGFLITLITIDMLLALVVFVIVVSLSRYISLGSVSAAISIPIIMVVRENVFNVDIAGYHTILPFVIAVALLVTYTHRANISRLIKGVENRISLSKKSTQK
jgi:glycerol-3-phosphate acyltransferase PlsY